MPEINHPYEIIDGKFMPSLAPISAHQRIALNMVTAFNLCTSKRSWRGAVCTGLDAIEELQILEMAPDLVIEVLSASAPKKCCQGSSTGSLMYQCTSEPMVFKFHLLSVLCLSLT